MLPVQVLLVRRSDHSYKGLVYQGLLYAMLPHHPSSMAETMGSLRPCLAIIESGVVIKLLNYYKLLSLHV